MALLSSPAVTDLWGDLDEKREKLARCEKVAKQNTTPKEAPARVKVLCPQLVAQ